MTMLKRESTQKKKRLRSYHLMDGRGGMEVKDKAVRYSVKDIRKAPFSLGKVRGLVNYRASLLANCISS